MKLTYFDINGGRSEPTRIAMSIGGIAFEDHRISFPEFGEMRSSLPLNAVPVLEVGGVLYTQSNAMTRYVGRQAGLYPDDPWQAFLVDEIMEVLEDMTHFIVQTFGLEGDELKAARAKLVDERLTKCLKLLDARLAAAGGAYFADNKLTIADLKVFVWVRALNSGNLDHVPTDLVEKIAPSLNEHMDRVGSDAGVAAYHEKLG